MASDAFSNRPAFGLQVGLELLLAGVEAREAVDLTFLY